MPQTTDASYVTAEAYAKAEKKYRKEFWKADRDAFTSPDRNTGTLGRKEHR
jgi:hypothetical protein